MKVLYVEDELSKNIPRITRLFSKYLRKEDLEELEVLEKDESGYGAEPEEIKRIVERTHIVEVDYRFPDALYKIVYHPEKYALFIIDRNLIEGQYKFGEVTEIDRNYTEAQHERYHEREGDYLLQTLVYSGVDVMTKFYFLTAYPAQDEIRSGEEIKTHINFGKFKIDNFIEKGNDADFERLQHVITDNKILRLQCENIYYLDILRIQIDDETSENFLKVLYEKDVPIKIANNSKEIRDIYEKMLQACAERIPNMREKCLDNYRKTILGLSVIDWLSINGYINTIHREFFYTINKITDVLCHSNSENSSTETVNALAYMLKEIILWFERICKKHSPK